MWSLRVERGYNRGTAYVLPAGALVVGRDEGAQVRIDAESVSRRHAELAVGAALEVSDLQSTNGIAVNGVPCREAQLEPGDRVRFGDVECRVLSEEDARDRPASTLVLEPEALTVDESPPQLADAPQIEWIGDSAPVKRLLGQVQRVAQADCAVLLRGETGTGKELIARAIHALSRRRKRAFVAVNCATLDGELLESELFGHERGAFTGANARKQGLVEAATGGVLFLDEVGELPLKAQAKLLRLLENGDYRRVGGTRDLHANCQVISATHRPLEDMVKAGGFREDLLFRLQVVELLLPPLRERGDDLALLIDHLFAKLRAQVSRRLTLGPEARAVLLGWRWPGNVRELKNALERAVILAPGPVVEVDDLPPGLATVTPVSDGFPTLEELELRHIRRALEHTDGARAEAARVLGIDRKTLYRKLKAYGLEQGS